MSKRILKREINDYIVNTFSKLCGKVIEYYSISENKGRKESIKVWDKPINANRVDFKFGLPEWQQKYSTTTNEFYTQKKLTGNRLTLDKEYLTPNYSGFKLIHFPQKEPFLTSNKRDFIEFKRKEEEKSKLNENQMFDFLILVPVLYFDV